MTAISFLILCLGSWGLTELLRHDHRIKELALAGLEEDTPLGRFFYQVQSCGFCLSHWAAIICVIVWQIPFCWWLVTIFAVVRVSNVLNDVTTKISRTPNKTMELSNERRTN